MASKRDFSQTGDVLDVACLMDAFENINSCSLSACITLAPRPGIPELILVLTATTKGPAPAAPVQLALSRFNLSALGYRTLKDAFTYALYQIDAQLGAAELVVRQPK